MEPILICRHHAPRLAVQLASSEAVHACPDADSCHCIPLEISEPELEDAKAGQWSKRILDLLKSEDVIPRVKYVGCTENGERYPC